MKRGLSLFFLIAFSLIAREELKIKSLEELSILSDKAYRKNKGNIFEVGGNVIITRGTETLYAQSGHVNLEEKKIDIQGNVRFTNQNLSIYGSRLIYHISDKSLEIFNARVLSKSFSIQGKYIQRKGLNLIFAKNAEYTTCQDCPNSWSIYGEEVKVTLGEYVRIKNALIKVRGVPMIYLPYFIFPIKRKRTSGFLVPQIYTSSRTKGITLQLPFFWAIDRSKDMTLSPTIFGERGLGGEFEYRSVFGQDKWLSFHGFDILDKKYRDPYRGGPKREVKYNRYFAHYEHKFLWGNYGNHHLVFNRVRDKDIVRDFLRETEGFYYGNELGVEGFFEFKNNLFQVSLESYFMDNLITDDPKEFDHHFVQVLPKISFSSTPFNIFKRKGHFLNSITMGMKGDMINFKQNHSTDTPDPPIRNAIRYHFNPYTDWILGNWGPIQLNSYLNFNYEFYQLPEIFAPKNQFEKWAILFKNELSFEIDRIYGMAYQVSIPHSQIKVKLQEKSEKRNSSDFIGDIPSFDSGLVEDYTLVKKNSYRHTQEWKLIHHQLLKYNHSGNTLFAEQIKTDAGLFDIVDSFEENEIKSLLAHSANKLPQENTIEIQWNSSFVRKTPIRGEYSSDKIYQKNFFDYKKIFYFNISQGLNMAGHSRKEKSFKKKLTRLFVESALTLDRFTFTNKEFYFYNGKHIYEFALTSSHQFLDYSVGFLFNSVDENVGSNDIRFALELRPTPLLRLKAKYDLDLSSQEENNRQDYEAIYNPRNNCWQVKLRFLDDAIETRIHLNLSVFLDSDFKGFL